MFLRLTIKLLLGFVGLLRSTITVENGQSSRLRSVAKIGCLRILHGEPRHPVFQERGQLLPLILAARNRLADQAFGHRPGFLLA
ncbi:hypothetical protein ACVLD2_000971 [Paenibacillus sp. PvR052]|nr:hypothetical protein [Paenibacillus sp. PvP091]MBP1169494.1 hypothetical protein [Paenibacillus sp. PvR098]MBP2440522.1 hypothetical protein [Paenibacillus sp. PvP052]